MATKLYVGNLSYGTTEQSLREAFEKAGTVVSAIIITDKFKNQSKGFGFVEMASEEEAKAAIEMWNDNELQGRKLRVNEARPMEDRPRRSFQRENNNYNNQW